MAGFDSTYGHSCQRAVKRVSQLIGPLMNIPASAQYLDVVLDQMVLLTERIDKRTRGPKHMIADAIVLCDIANEVLLKFKSGSPAFQRRLLASQQLFSNLIQAFMALSEDDILECVTLADRENGAFLKFLDLPLTVASWRKADDVASQDGAADACLQELRNTLGSVVVPRLLSLALDITQVGRWGLRLHTAKGLQRRDWGQALRPWGCPEKAGGG
jgi:hypothetical protein